MTMILHFLNLAQQVIQARGTPAIHAHLTGHLTQLHLSETQGVHHIQLALHSSGLVTALDLITRANALLGISASTGIFAPDVKVPAMVSMNV